MTIRKLTLREFCLTVLGVGLMGLAAAYVMRARLWPTPSLDGVRPLLDGRRFDEAERAIANYLRYDRDSPQANLMMAQVCLARDDQKPRLALDHLARIRADSRALKAMILLNEGKAHSALGRNDRAESAWKEALRLDPRAPEVGWDLLGLYYVQGRRDDAHRLGLALHAIEPDPRDRVQLLLELLREDAQSIGPDSLIRTLEPIVRADPEDLHTAVALGLALVRNSQLDEGLAVLREQVARSGDRADAWDALLFGLDEAGKFDELVEVLGRLPPTLTADPRFERYRGTVFQHRQDWPRAAESYLHAWRHDPSDFRVLYRLNQALRAAGRLEEAGTFDRKVRHAQAAQDQMLALYEEANAITDLGIAPHPRLYHRIAEAREQMGRYDEALAWHRLVARDQPDDPISRAAIDRLESTISALQSAGPDGH